MNQEFPNECTFDLIGTIVQLKEDASANAISIYGKDEQYVIDFTKSQELLDRVGNELHGSITTLDEFMRFFTVDEYDKSERQCHGLMTGKGCYQRLTEKFKIIGKRPPSNTTYGVQ